MNEKYIQALILGTIIGFAIIIDDFIAPKQNHTMTQKHLMVKDIKTPNWKEDSGKKIELHEIEDHDVFIFKPDDKTVKKNELKQIYKIKIDTEDGDDEESKKEIIKLMSTGPKWMGNVPLDAEAIITKEYTK